MHPALQIARKREADIAPAQRLPLEERNLADRLNGRRVLIVIDDADFIPMRELVREFLGHANHTAASIRIMSWTEFLYRLPDQERDLVIVSSPRTFKETYVEFEKGLASFRKNNPKAFVAMSNLYCPGSSEAQLLDGLRTESFIDHVEQGYLFFPKLLHFAAERMEQRADAKV